nr:hypothetical protein [uncultured Allomuricauda sp.]
MNTRKNFLTWINTLNNPFTSQINRSHFMSIHEKGYLFNTIERLLESNDDLKPIVADYYQLEKQRYHVFETSKLDTKLAIEKIDTAITFCSKPDKEKRLGTFKMNSSISNYLAQSTFLWDFDDVNHIEEITTHYFFIPSFLPIAPKEICLTGMDSLLLDIIHYEEKFTYQELFELVRKTLDMEPDEIDELLFRFVQNQILYFGTILPV